MASTPSPAEPLDQFIRVGEFGRRIEARKAALGLPDPPRNAGANRTPSKGALLKAIEDAGGEW